MYIYTMYKNEFFHTLSFQVIYITVTSHVSIYGIATYFYIH